VLQPTGSWWELTLTLASCGSLHARVEFSFGVGLPACLPVSVCLLSSLCLNSLNRWVVEVSVWQLCGDYAGALPACIIESRAWQQLYKLPVTLHVVFV
jgi:hypothetical protein